MTAFVLGNGLSRKNLDIEQLMKIAPVYGCNALYRTHTPTVLVATDKPISQQIQESGYPKRNRFYTRRPIKNLGALPVPQKYFGFSSGPIATAIAAAENHSPVYMIGFDMGPSETGRFNNVFADTEFYKKSEGVPTFTGNWVKQIITVANDFSNTKFIRVFGSTTASIPEFDKINNLYRMDWSDFINRLTDIKLLQRVN